MEHSTNIGKKLKILFITQEDPFYIRIFFSEFFEHCANDYDIAGVVICTTMGSKSTLQLAKQMYAFYGFADFIRMIWRFCLIKIKGNNLSGLCRNYKINFYRNNAINCESFIERWREAGIDVIISVAAPLRFKKKLLELPRWGCINIHHAKLPDFQGMMPNFWQMYQGKTHSGITVHRMNSKIDQGEIILQAEVPILPRESLDQLIKKTKKEGAIYIARVLRLISMHKVCFIPNPTEKGRYFGFPTREDVSEFRRRGRRIL